MRRGEWLALGAGLATPFAFAPFHLFPLAVLAPALLFVQLRGVGPGRAAWRGFLYGLGFFGVGVSWVYVSLHVYGHMPAPLAGFTVMLFCVGLALYPLALGALQTRWARVSPAVHLALALPALWVLFEWLRGWFLTGFPWLNLGYSQIHGPLAGYAPWLGVYGVSLATASSAGLLAAAWCDRARARLYLPVLALVWLGGWAAAQAEFVRPHGEALRAVLVQGNIPLAAKWRPEQRQAIVERYVALSEQAPAADLIVWPESAVPGYLQELGPVLLPRLESLARTRGADFILGIVEQDSRRPGYYNSVISVGREQGIYRKQHLVPFGEFLPMPALFGWLIEHLQIPMSNFTAGDAGQAPVAAAGQRVGISVCYEDAFGEEVIRALPRATLLVNVSEDAWFGNSLGPHQRLQMAQMRALETGRPMLRAANTGPSAAIDHRGRVLARSPQFVERALAVVVQPMQGATFYVRHGNFPAVSLAALLLIAAAVGHRAARSAKAPVESEV